MQGKGTFFDPRLDDAAQFPLAARARLGHKRSDVDLITPKLAPLHAYQLAIPAPTPPENFVGDTFDSGVRAGQVDRGRALFTGRAQCANCHIPPLFTEPVWNLHTAAEIERLAAHVRSA